MADGEVENATEEVQPNEEADASGGLRLKRTRSRAGSLKIDRAEIAERIQRFYDKDTQDRAIDIGSRLQRYAKYRMWTEGKQWPWPDATDAALPDMMTAAMRLEDTLHNAVLSQRPAIMAKAVQQAYRDKEETVNHLIDYQFFEEQGGEHIVGQLAHDFVLEGHYTAFTPWIDEKRRVREVKLYDPIPPDSTPAAYFRSIVDGFFPRATVTVAGGGWDFTAEERDGKKFKASFFTKDSGEVELDIEREAQVFLGPRALRKDLQDVLYPWGCENLQIPGPSNPMGAAHVILKDSPTVDEIKRLRDDGSYDLLTKEDAEKLGILRKEQSDTERDQQKAVMQGHVAQSDTPKDAESQQKLTRLMCFDCFDIDGDGLDEDVVWWMILESKIILKARYLSEVFPAETPRRPFAEAQLFNVPGSRTGIGLLEMMEGVHDLMKQFMDQGGDAGTIGNTPFGFYRAASNMRPEVIRLAPGELYPLSDPKNDVAFPQIGNQNQSFMFNFMTLLTQLEEKLTNIGELQLGRVPQGKASALRTVAGMQTVLAQGDARPERVLRRFFMGLADLWRNFHELNEALLPAGKRFKVCGFVDPREDPYAVTDRKGVKGNFLFTFSANALNTSKEATRQALEALLTAYVNPLAIQLGIIKPDGIYRLERDYGRSMGQDPDKYLSPPTPGAQEPPINAEEAILELNSGQMPKGTPMEGTEEHFEKLQAFVNSDEFGHFERQFVPLFRAYLQKVAEGMAQERAQAALAQAAQQFGQGMQRPGIPGPTGSPMPGDQGPTPVQGGELLDESLPGAGGGANQGQPA